MLNEEYGLCSGKYCKSKFCYSQSDNSQDIENNSPEEIDIDAKL